MLSGKTKTRHFQTPEQGFYIKPEDPETGNLFIGLSIVLGFFVVMPLFIYHRWKNRSVKDYMLTKESIEKMREFNNSKDKKNNLG